MSHAHPAYPPPLTRQFVPPQRMPNPRGAARLGGRQNWTPRNVDIVGRGRRHHPGRGGGYYWYGGGFPYYAGYPGCYAVPYPPYYACPSVYPYTSWGYPYYAGYRGGPWGGGNPWL